MQVANKKRVHDKIIRSYMTTEDVLVNRGIAIPMMMDQPFFAGDTVKKSAHEFQKKSK